MSVVGPLHTHSKVELVLNQSNSLIQTQGELEQLDLVSDLIGIDHEFHLRDTYHPVASLVQLATRKGAVAIDLLAGLDLHTLRDAFQNPAIRFICHDSLSELPLMVQFYQKLPRDIVDTQLAHSFLDPSSLHGYAHVVKQCKGIVLDKSAQTSSWLNRPLNPNQIKYAIADVEHLIDLWEYLQAKLKKTNKLAWFLEEQRTRCARTLVTSDYGQSALQFNPRFGKLHYSLMRDLLNWREQRAVRLDRPRRWILQDHYLTDLVLAGTKGPGVYARKIRELKLHKQFDELMTSLTSWQQLISDLPRHILLGKSITDHIVAEIKTIRDRVAAKYDILPDVLLRRKQMLELIDTMSPPLNFPAWFGNWRQDLMGEDIKAVFASLINPT